MQNVVSVFDDSVVLSPSPKVSTVDRCLSLYEFVKDGRYPLFTFWDHGYVSTKKAYREVDTGDGRMGKMVSVTGTRIPYPEWRKDKDKFSRMAQVDTLGVPSDDFTTRPAVFEWQGGPLKDPVWVDLFTGAVYAIPAPWQIAHSCGVSLVRIPMYDSPCLVTERAALDLM